MDAGLINHYYWFRLAAEVGVENMRAQLKYLEAGDPGSIVNVTGAGVLGTAEGDADALAFVEYLLSDEGQNYFVEQTFEYPLVPGIEAPEGLPALDSLVNPELDLSDLDDLADDAGASRPRRTDLGAEPPGPIDSAAVQPRRC